MNLDEAIAEAQTHLTTDPPPNESCTCEWVILPLLRACGYVSHREIFSRVADNNGQYPDYTMLPDHPQGTWYLEAKVWNVSLEDKHAQQSLNYANHNGKRFVVLTNGQVWRLYDNAIQGLVHDKMIVQAKLEDTSDTLAFLGRLTRDAVVSGQLENSAAKARLHSLIAKQIFDPSSDIVVGIRSVIRRDSALSRIKGEDIVACLRDILSAHQNPVPLTPLPVSQAKPVISVPSTSRQEQVNPLPEAKIIPTTGTITLQELANKVRKEGYQVVANTKPSRAVFPDGSRWDGGDWADFAEAFVKWLCERNKLPKLPFSGSERGKNYLLNSTPYHSDSSQMNVYRQIRCGITNIFLFTNMSAERFVLYSHALCLATDSSPTDIHIKLS